MNLIFDLARDPMGNFLDHYVIEAALTFVILALSVTIGLLIGWLMWRKRAIPGTTKVPLKLGKAWLASIFFSLIGTTIISFFFVLRHEQTVEKVLGDRMSGIENITIEYENFTAMVTGQATKRALSEIQKQVEGKRDGNGRVKYDVEILKSQSSTFTIFRDGEQITLQGQVDSEETKKHFGDTAAIIGLTIKNQLAVSDEVARFPSFVSAIAAIPHLFNSTSNTRLEANPKKVVVSGLVSTPELKKTIMGLFGTDKWGGATIVDQLKVPPPPPSQPIPPSLSWKQEGSNQVILAGSLPSQAVRDSLIKTAKELAGTVESEQLKVGANVMDAAWLAAFPKFATGIFPKISNPELRLGPNDSVFTGTVVNNQIRQEVIDALLELNPPGMNVDFTIEPLPRTKIPYIEVTGPPEYPDVKGLIPTKESGDLIVNAIRKIKNDLKIADDVKVEDWLTPLPKFIETFYAGEVKNPQFSLRDKVLTLDGEVKSEAVRDGIILAASPLTQLGVKVNYRLKIEIASPPVERYQLFFETGEFHIRDSEMPKAEQIKARAEVTRGKIVIHGYADERGNSDANKRLSEQRATEVRGDLIKNGIDEKRIAIEGRGEVSGDPYQDFRRTDVQIFQDSE